MLKERRASAIRAATARTTPTAIPCAFAAVVVPFRRMCAGRCLTPPLSPPLPQVCGPLGEKSLSFTVPEGLLIDEDGGSITKVSCCFACIMQGVLVCLDGREPLPP